MNPDENQRKTYNDLIVAERLALAQRDEAVALLKKHFECEGERFLGREGVRRLHEDTEAFLLRLEKGNT